MVPLVACLLAAQPVSTRQPTPTGVIVASAGDRVLLIEPTTGAATPHATGPVGFLYPAPGGRLFAPDLVNGRTAVFDLRSWKIAERLDGVTMPRFGSQSDRYLVVAGDLLAFSYPERAPLLRIAAEVESPWQVAQTPDDMMALILDRRPDGTGPTTLVVVDLAARQVSQRAILPGDVTRMALSTPLGVLAFADRTGRAVLLVEPATLATVTVVPVDGRPVDVAFTADGHRLVAVAEHDGRGSLAVVELKPAKKGLKLKPRATGALSAAPVRLALSPTGEFAAVGLASGRLAVAELDHGGVLYEVELGEAPRDVVWCDPALEGPPLPEWSDRLPTPATRDLRRPGER